MGHGEDGQVPVIDEASLLGRARNGDHQAFGVLLRSHDDRMRRLAGRLLGDAGAMDDVLQDAYLKAFRNLDGFAGRSTFATWLYTITYRTALDHLRRTSRRPEVRLDQVETIASTAGPVADTVAERAELRQALADLPPDQAAAVILVDGEGLSYDEAAEVLGTKPGTVASRLNRGRSELRTRLGPGREGGRP